ncbi:MAG: hypothetical protein ACOCQQ_01700 [Candidatus Nanoarchaeia archaeon]
MVDATKEKLSLSMQGQLEKILSFSKEHVLSQKSIAYHSFADDIAQEVSLRFFKAATKRNFSFDSELHLYNWTKKVTFQSLIDLHRKQTKTKAKNISYVGGFTDLEYLDVRTENLSSCFDSDLSDTAYNTLTKFVDVLPTRQKKVFWCALNNPEYKPKDVRTQLGISHSAIKDSCYKLRQSAIKFKFAKRLYD